MFNLVIYYLKNLINRNIWLYVYIKIFYTKNISKLISFSSKTKKRKQICDWVMLFISNTISPSHQYIQYLFFFSFFFYLDTGKSWYFPILTISYLILCICRYIQIIFFYVIISPFFFLTGCDYLILFITVLVNLIAYASHIPSLVRCGRMKHSKFRKTKIAIEGC